MKNFVHTLGDSLIRITGNRPRVSFNRGFFFGDLTLQFLDVTENPSALHQPDGECASIKKKCLGNVGI